MTNEQLTQEVMKLAENQAKTDVILEELKEDIKTTKSLAEDVHILALNMETMQKTVDETKRTVDTLNSKEYTEYKENKKLVKQNIRSGVIGAVVAFALGLIGWIVRLYIIQGG